jgi:hypothetical protein
MPQMRVAERTGIISMILRATYYMVSLIAIPIQVSNIGLDKFGYLSLILSVNILMPLIELGTGFPILNMLTDKVVKSRSETLEFLRKITELYMAISMILVMSYATFYVLNHLKVVPLIVSVSKEVLIILILITISLVINLFANLAFRCLLAIGEGFTATFSQNLGMILGVVSTTALTFVTDSIILLVVPMLFIPSLTIFLFFFSSKTRVKQLRRVKNIVKLGPNKDESDDLKQQSFTYFTLNLGNVLSLHFGGIIIALSLTPADLGSYYVVWKYVTFFSSMITALYSIQWSDHRKKFNISGARYHTEVITQHKKSLLLGILSFIPIQLLTPKVLEIWSNGKILIDSRISTVLAFYILVFAVSYPINMYFNVTYSRKVLLSTGLLTNVMNLLLTVMLLRLTKSYSSPILGSILAIMLFTYIPQFYIFKIKRKSCCEI